VQLRSKLVFFEVSDRYLERNGDDVRAKYPGPEKFASQFEVTQPMLEQILGVAKAKGIEFDKENYEKDLKFIKAFTKAHIARRIWGNEGSARVMLNEDGQFKKAITLFPEAEKIASLR
jgi:carboxyl-terminal processing protease